MTILCPFAGLPDPLHGKFERLRMQPMVDLPYTGQRRRMRLVEHGQQAEQADRAV